MIEHHLPPSPTRPPIDGGAIQPPPAPPVDFWETWGWLGALLALCGWVIGCGAYFFAAAQLLRSPLIGVFESAFMLACLFWMAMFWVATMVMALLARRIRWAFRLLAGALVPLPLMVLVLGFLIYDETLLKRRFDDSRGELEAIVAQYDSGRRVFEKAGDFDVVYVERREGCFFIATDSWIDEYGGFAHCTGRRPSRPNLNMSHLRDEWWTFNHMDGID